MERGLVQRGVSVTTLTSDHALGADRPDACASRVYKHLWTARYKMAPGMLPFLWRHVRDFDVVHIHALFSFAATAAAWCARMRRVPYVVRPLGTLSDYGVRHRRPLLKRLSIAAIEAPILAHAAAVHFTSEEEAEEARRLVGRLRSAIIPLGLDAPDAASPEAVQRLRQRVGGRRPVLFLSRLDPKKNLESLIEAFARSESLRATCALVVAGDGDPDYRTRCEEQARKAGVADLIHWLGHVEGDQKAAAFAIAEIFVLPSYSENFGIAAAEAMLAGLPCVLSPGIAITHEAHRAGAAEVGGPDPASVKIALERLIENAPLRRLQGERARSFAHERYSVAIMTQRLIGLYRDIKHGTADAS